MEDSEAQTKTFTLPLNFIQQTELISNEQLYDRLAELILEFYEDGKYSYSDYKTSNKKIPDAHRQAKTRVKKFLNKFNSESSFACKVFNTFFLYMCEMDESLITRLKTKNRKFVKENKELKLENETLKALNQELQDDMDSRVKNVLDNEVSNLLEDTMREEREQHRASMKKRFDIISKQDEEMQKLRQSILNSNQQIVNEKASLVEELHNAKVELQKYKECNTGNVGRPKLTKKEKKRRKMEKLKKQLQELESSDSDCDSDSD